jgi:hypothetical protein
MVSKKPDMGGSAILVFDLHFGLFSTHSSLLQICVLGWSVFVWENFKRKN